jgi:hypothetical protein
MQWGFIHKLPLNLTQRGFTEEGDIRKEEQRDEQKKYIDENHKTSHHIVMREEKIYCNIFKEDNTHESSQRNDWKYICPDSNNG